MTSSITKLAHYEIAHVSGGGCDKDSFRLAAGLLITAFIVTGGALLGVGIRDDDKTELGLGIFFLILGGIPLTMITGTALVRGTYILMTDLCEDTNQHK